MTEQQLRAELNSVKQKADTLAKEFAVINSQITIRKIELSAEGQSAKPKSTTDEKLIHLLSRAKELNEALKNLNNRRKELNKMVPPKQKQKKPRGERPKNRVYMGSEFRDCTGYERRLALLMAYEIGQERYIELKRQASDDTRNGETDFYTGGQRSHWDDACRRPEIKVADDFERMMRSNFNRFAGEEV